MAAIAPTPGKAGTASPGRSHNLALRIGSALVLAPLALAAAYYDDWPFALFWTLAAVAVLWEWIALVAGAGYRLMFYSGAGAIAVSALVDERGRPVTAILVIGLGALAVAIFAPRGKRLWIVGGVGYAGTLLLAPMLLRHDQSQGFGGLGNGFIALLFLFAVVWATDVLGYFGGRAFGGRKLAPAISPGKTWSGAVVGTIGAMAVTAAGAHCPRRRQNLRGCGARAGAVGGGASSATSWSRASSGSSAPRTPAISFPAMAASWTASTGSGRRRWSPV